MQYTMLAFQLFLVCSFSKKKKSLYLSVSLFSTALLIGDTVNKETNIVNQQKLVKNPNW